LDWGAAQTIFVGVRLLHYSSCSRHHRREREGEEGEGGKGASTGREGEAARSSPTRGRFNRWWEFTGAHALAHDRLNTKRGREGGRERERERE
jgi:hypothetical protein